jgi:hypothetical protein
MRGNTCVVINEKKSLTGDSSLLCKDVNLPPDRPILSIYCPVSHKLLPPPRPWLFPSAPYIHISTHLIYFKLVEDGIGTLKIFHISNPVTFAVQHDFVWYFQCVLLFRGPAAFPHGLRTFFYTKHLLRCKVLIYGSS